MKEYYKKYKELRKNKRIRALMSLGLWLIFFMFVAIIFNTAGRPATPVPSAPTPTTLETYKNVESYEFEFVIDTLIEEQTIISGIYYNENYYFENDNKEYYLTDDVLYLVDTDNKILTSVLDKFLELDIRFLKNSALLKIMSESEVDNAVEYKDGTIKTTYTGLLDDNTINMIVEEQNKIINNISITFDRYVIEINYTNINNINNYKTNYNTYIIK